MLRGYHGNVQREAALTGFERVESLIAGQFNTDHIL